MIGKILFSLAFLLLATATYATTDTALVKELDIRLQQYDECKGFQGLYLHTDKTIYRNNEHIWFSAYQLTPADTLENTLFVVLQRIGEDTILSVSRYIMQHGIGKGSIYLDDSLKGGDYRLLAFTNMQMGQPGKHVFQQLFTLESIYRVQHTLIKTAVDAPKVAGENYRARYKVILDDGSSGDKGKVTYTLRSDSAIIANGSLMLANQGEMTIEVPASYCYKHLSLQTILHDGKNTSKVVQSLRIEPALDFRFYPESGHLLEGVPNRLAFEVSSDSLVPDGYMGYILEDGKPLVAIRTDQWGRGQCLLTPSKGKQYTLSLNNNKNYNCEFPEVEQDGCIMSVANDVVTDSVRVVIHSSKTENEYTLLLHNYKEIFAVHTINFAGKNKVITLPLSGLETVGVLTLTLMDKDKQALAERCIYNKDDNDLIVRIQTDSARYKADSKVVVRIAIKDNKGRPVKGVFSLGCVLSLRRNKNLIVDLPAFYYAGQYQQSAQRLVANFNQDDAASLHLLLLIDFWSKYRWGNMMHTAFSPQQYNRLGIEGRFEYDARPLKRPIDYAMMKSDGSYTFSTDSNGRFTLYYKSLYDAPDRMISILPIVSKGRYDDVKAFRLTSGFGIIEHVGMYAARNNEYPFLRLKEPMQQYILKDKRILKEVKIISAVEKETPWCPKDFEYVSKDCKDYVCRFNVLNCLRHPRMEGGTTPPIKDRTYYYYPMFNDLFRVEIIYRGCADDLYKEDKPAEFMTHLKATWKNKEFYVRRDGELVVGNTRESTLFWSHQIVTNDEGEADAQFYTNSLSGDFTLHLQGFSKKGPFSATQQFFVTD